MEYNVKLTDEFITEIDDICNYISNNLKAPESANKLREKVMYNILLLEKSPKMFEKIEKFDRIKRNYRRIVIKNYVVLYTIDEKSKIVFISHIYYSKMNYLN